jgi:hypothetical protein
VVLPTLSILLGLDLPELRTDIEKILPLATTLVPLSTLHLVVLLDVLNIEKCPRLQPSLEAFVVKLLFYELLHLSRMMMIIGTPLVDLYHHLVPLVTKIPESQTKIHITTVSRQPNSKLDHPANSPLTLSRAMAVPQLLSPLGVLLPAVLPHSPASESESALSSNIRLHSNSSTAPSNPSNPPRSKSNSILPPRMGRMLTK